jgi:mRNA interferase RelE/StbE
LAYNVVDKKSVGRDLKKPPKAEARRILDRIEGEPAEKAHTYPVLKGRFAGLRKYRVGDYRVVFALVGDDVIILRIGHGKNVYNKQIERRLSGGSATLHCRVVALPVIGEEMKVQFGFRQIFERAVDPVLRAVARACEAECSGVKFDLDTEDDVQFDIYFNIYERRVLKKVLPLVARGGACLDAGANVGVFALRFAQRVGPSGIIHAFEPDPVNYERLHKNIELNGLGGYLRAPGGTLGQIRFRNVFLRCSEPVWVGEPQRILRCERGENHRPDHNSR